MVVHVGMGRAVGTDRGRGAAGKSSSLQLTLVFHKNLVHDSLALLAVRRISRCLLLISKNK